MTPSRMARQSSAPQASARSKGHGNKSAMERRVAREAACHRAGRKCPSEAGRGGHGRPQGPETLHAADGLEAPRGHLCWVHGDRGVGHQRVTLLPARTGCVCTSHAYAQLPCPPGAQSAGMIPPGHQHTPQGSSTRPSHLTGPKGWSLHGRGPAPSLGTERPSAWSHRWPSWAHAPRPPPNQKGTPTSSSEIPVELSFPSSSPLGAAPRKTASDYRCGRKRGDLRPSQRLFCDSCHSRHTCSAPKGAHRRLRHASLRTGSPGPVGERPGHGAVPRGALARPPFAARRRWPRKAFGPHTMRVDGATSQRDPTPWPDWRAAAAQATRSCRERAPGPPRPRRPGAHAAPRAPADSTPEQPSGCGAALLRCPAGRAPASPCSATVTQLRRSLAWSPAGARRVHAGEVPATGPRSRQAASACPRLPHRSP